MSDNEFLGRMDVEARLKRMAEILTDQGPLMGSDVHPLLAAITVTLQEMNERIKRLEEQR